MLANPSSTELNLQDFAPLIHQFRSISSSQKRLSLWLNYPDWVQDGLEQHMGLTAWRNKPLSDWEIRETTKTKPIGSIPERSCDAKFLVRTLAKGGLPELVRVCRICQIMVIPNFHLFNLSLDEVKKHFQFGVYQIFKINLPVGEYTLIAAWLYGFSWDEMIVPVWGPGVHRPAFVKNMIGLNGRDARLLIESIILSTPKPIPIKEFLDFTQNYLTRFYWVERDPAYQVQIVDLKDRLSHYISCHNYNGIAFCPPAKDYLLGLDEDYKIIPLVQHLDHVRLLPGWPKLFSMDRNTNNIHLLPSALHKDRAYPYPRFSKSRYCHYPKELKIIIFQFLLIFNRQRQVLPLGKDLLQIFLDYLVFNYYFHLEEQIKEWTALSQEYSRLGVLRDRCLDTLIVDVDSRENSGCIKALNDLEHTNLKSTKDLYISYVADRKNWKVFTTAFAGQVYDVMITNMERIGRACYDHELAISLVQSGRIKITSQGEIVNLEEAIQLSQAKRASDKASGLKLLQKDPSTKKRRTDDP